MAIVLYDSFINGNILGRRGKKKVKLKEKWMLGLFNNSNKFGGN